MMNWLVKASNFISRPFSDWGFRFDVIAGCGVVILMYTLYLILTKGALFIRDNNDGTQTEWFLFGKRTVKKDN